MTQYEVVVNGENNYQFVIQCRSKRHAIQVFSALSRAKCSLVDMEELPEFHDPMSDMAIHGHGHFMGYDDAWTVLGVNWRNKKRIDFAHPEKNFEDLGSVKI